LSHSAGTDPFVSEHTQDKPRRTTHTTTNSSFNHSSTQAKPQLVIAAASKRCLTPTLIRVPRALVLQAQACAGTDGDAHVEGVVAAVASNVEAGHLGLLDRDHRVQLGGQRMAWGKRKGAMEEETREG